MAAILERVRGAAVAAGRAAVEYKVVDAIIAGVSGGAGFKVSEYLKTNKTTYKLYSSMKEWADFVAGFGLVMIYELLKKRIPNIPYLDKIVYGVGSVMMANSIAVLLGEPFAIITEDGKLYVKHISPKNNTLFVLVDGNPNEYDTVGGKFSNDIPEGTHDIVVIGVKKGKYLRQYTPAITGSGGGGGAVTRSATVQTK